MSTITRLRGAVIASYLSPPLRRAKHALHRLRGRADRVRVYLEAGDPHSFLLAQTLPALIERYRVQVRVLAVPPMAPEANPEPDLRRAWAIRDARALAGAWQLSFPDRAPADGPDPEQIARADAVLARPRPTAQQVRAAIAVGEALWSGDDAALAATEAEFGAVSAAQAQATLAEHAIDRRRRGHYQGAMLWWCGEWFWGVDRLGHLEARLRGDGDATSRILTSREPPALSVTGDRLVMFHSFRSPYSYLALARAQALCERFELRLELRPVLPMVTRGLPVPPAKRLYIARDAKREADRLGVPFGRICDPLGEGVARCLAVWAHADAAGRGLAFARSAGAGIWSEALDMTDDADLAVAVRRAGLDWDAARASLADDGWRERVETHRAEMTALGVWGVPSLAIGDAVLWGQDRLPLLERALARRANST